MEEVKNFFNILFFITMIALGLLSYLQARKTLFSPIKTEIFKIQIEEFKSVLAFFNKRSSTDFDHEFDLHKTLELNALRMQCAYISLFFKDKVTPTEEMINFLKNTGHGMLVNETQASKFFRQVSPGSELKTRTESSEEELTAATILARWGEFMLPGTEYTIKYFEKMEELTQLAASPLLPKQLKDLIYDFRDLMNKQLEGIGKHVHLAAKEMPSRYSTASDAMKFNPAWIWNKFNHDRESTNDASAKILGYINEHLKIEEIMK